MDSGVFSRPITSLSSSNTVRFRTSATSSTASSSNHPNGDHPGRAAAVAATSSLNSNNSDDRIVLVRYYLDRPGYDLSNSSSRLWINPPCPSTTPNDILQFLHDEGIKSNDENDPSHNLLVELFLDTYQTFMLLEACNDYNIHFDFSHATSDEPGILNIRLTDLNDASSSPSQNQNMNGGSNTINIPPRCNTSPVGLFAFAMTVGLDALNVLRELTEDESSALNPSFLLIFGPYAFFVSGLIQFMVGLNEISRNNIYGATAFLGFGSFWLANGTTLILTTYFPDQIPVEIQSSPATATANFVRECYIMLFACALFKQTLAMNKLTTGLLGTLIIYLLAASLSGWNDAFLWIKMVLGFVLSVYGLFLFYAELTNEVYHRTVIDLYPWNANSSEEAFGAAGRANGLQSMAIDLRTAGHHDVLLLNSNNTINPANSITMEMPTKKSERSAYHLRDVRPDKSK